MIRSFCLFSIFYLLISVLPVSAQNQREPAGRQGTVEQRPETTQSTRRQALSLNIESRVLQDKVVVWREVNQSVSMPGVPVGVQLGGSNIVVVVQFTPYTARRDNNVVRRDNSSVRSDNVRPDENVLVAQGQIWIAEVNGIVTYYTSMQTIPMTFGEPIHYFPLGTSENLNPSIEIVITVNSVANSEDGR